MVLFFKKKRKLQSKGKVFYGQEPPSGEFTTTECGVNYQLLAVMYWSSPMENPNCSQPQPATDNGVRDGRSNWLVALPTLMGSTPWAPRAEYKSVQPQRDSNVQTQHARQPPCLCCCLACCGCTFESRWSCTDSYVIRSLFESRALGRYFHSLIIWKTLYKN